MSEVSYRDQMARYFGSAHQGFSSEGCRCFSSGGSNGAPPPPCKLVQHAMFDGNLKTLEGLAATNHTFEGASLLLSVRHCGEHCTRLILENGSTKDGPEALQQAKVSSPKSTVELLSQFEP
jgi:hypothetical protein